MADEKRLSYREAGKQIGKTFHRTVVEIGDKRFVAVSHLAGHKVKSTRQDGTLILDNGLPVKLIKEIKE